MIEATAAAAEKEEDRTRVSPGCPQNVVKPTFVPREKFPSICLKSRRIETTLRNSPFNIAKFNVRSGRGKLL